MITSRKVRQGAELLDWHGPANWVDRVDPSTLDLNSEAYCVLGQVYGSFDDGIGQLHGYMRQGLLWDYGFNGGRFAEWSWRREIRRRRAHARRAGVAA